MSLRASRAAPLLLSLPCSACRVIAAMASRRGTTRLPYSSEHVFDLVADIERYPEFVPGYASARILSREGDRLVVEQTIGLSGFRERFVSEAQLERPARIVVRSRGKLLQRLEIDWQFTDTSDGCEVTLLMNYRFSSKALDFALLPLLDLMAEQTLRAFVRRAHEQYAERR
jgi:coenzyme Q-binding protein COQ10